MAPVGTASQPRLRGAPRTGVTPRRRTRSCGTSWSRWARSLWARRRSCWGPCSGDSDGPRTAVQHLRTPSTHGPRRPPRWAPDPLRRPGSVALHRPRRPPRRARSAGAVGGRRRAPSRWSRGGPRGAPTPSGCAPSAGSRDAPRRPPIAWPRSTPAAVDVRSSRGRRRGPAAAPGGVRRRPRPGRRGDLHLCPGGRFADPRDPPVGPLRDPGRLSRRGVPDVLPAHSNRPRNVRPATPTEEGARPS